MPLRLTSGRDKLASDSINLYKKTPVVTQSTSSKSMHVNVICIQWGNAYLAEDINKLYNMITRNTRYAVDFYLFSNENLTGLNKKIIQQPEPGVKLPPSKGNLNYRKTVGLCDKHLAGLEGQRVYFFDLDVVILDNLDELFEFPVNDKFYIINDWNTKGNHVGQATCYSYIAGSLSYIKEDFESNTDAIVSRYGTATQQYLSAKVIEKFGSMEFWPDEWFQSFKFHCLAPIFIRRLVTPKKPKLGTKVLAFHGNPNIQDAIAGRWCTPSNAKKENAWKIFYKKFQAAKWINDYWK